MHKVQHSSIKLLPVKSNCVMLKMMRTLKTSIVYPQNLPIIDKKSIIMEAIKENQVIVIAGETGSGKTTQIPKICLELGRGSRKLIGHTQPRRIAARSIAEQIARELGVKLGEEVGYQVRFNSVTNKRTLLKLMTDGILLNEIQHDRLLQRYDTIIIDEAHERTLNIDFILGYLKQLIPQRPDLKVIITSATINPELFANHFQIEGNPVPIIEVSGRTYPIEIRYQPIEEDWNQSDTLDNIVRAVDNLSREKAGDMLIFLSGEREIRDTLDALKELKTKNFQLKNTDILPLYSRLSLNEQHQVFQEDSRAKIILATNIAETSLTIPNIKYVIDSGTARISRYSNRTKVQRLPIEQISQASAKQRAGRCGRTSDGICIRLYSESEFNESKEFTDPEISRTNLASVILQMTALGLGDINKFTFLESPDPRSIKSGVQLLLELNAIEKPSKELTLTKYGEKLAKIPLDPRLGRILLESHKQECLLEAIIITSAISIQEIREYPADKKDLAIEKHKKFHDKKSDFISYLILWKYIEEKQLILSKTQFRKFCKSEFLNYLRIREWQELVKQIQNLLKDINIPNTQTHIDPSGKETPIHISLLSGFLSQIAVKNKEKNEYLGTRGSKVHIFPSSGLFKSSPPWIMSAQIIETSKMWAHTNATIDPLWVEKLAPETIKYSYSEPRWEKKQAATFALEKAMFLGIPIIANRKINYKKIDPTLCRENFIRYALVEKEWHTYHKFFHNNNKKIDSISDTERITRTILPTISDDTLYDFYDQKIPQHIISGITFDSWWKKLQYNNPKFLDLPENILQEDNTNIIDWEKYPNLWKINTPEPLKIIYQFDNNIKSLPQKTVVPYKDGITIEIPIFLLYELKDKYFSWNIPGVREEIVNSLIKNLPKPIRKNLVPVNHYTKKIINILETNFSPESEEFLSAITKSANIVANQSINIDTWAINAIPEHLKITFRILDKNKQFITENKNLKFLQNSLTSTHRTLTTQILDKTTLKKAEKSNNIEKQNIQIWDFGTLQDSINLNINNNKILGYPTLVTREKQIDLIILYNKEESYAANRKSIINLAAKSLPLNSQYIKNHLSSEEKILFKTSCYSEQDNIIKDCFFLTINSMLPQNLPQNKEEFTEITTYMKEKIFDETFKNLTHIKNILKNNITAEQSLTELTNPNFSDTKIDIEGQISYLIYPGFIAEITPKYLTQIQKYLQAIVHRINKLPQNITQNNANMTTMQNLEDRYDTIAETIKEKFSFETPNNVSDIKWLLEELRISLFAQHLKTIVTVSKKRIEKNLTEIEQKYLSN